MSSASWFDLYISSNGPFQKNAVAFGSRIRIKFPFDGQGQKSWATLLSHRCQKLLFLSFPSWPTPHDRRLMTDASQVSTRDARDASETSRVSTRVSWPTSRVSPAHGLMTRDTRDASATSLVCHAAASTRRGPLSPALHSSLGPLCVCFTARGSNRLVTGKRPAPRRPSLWQAESQDNII